MMAMVMESEEGCVQLVHAAIHIGLALEQEVIWHYFVFKLLQEWVSFSLLGQTYNT